MNQYLIDVDYYYKENQSSIRITKLSDFKIVFSFDNSFFPYFYLKATEEEIDNLKKINIIKNNEEIKIKKIEKQKLKINGIETDLLKIICYKPNHISIIKEKIPSSYEKFEYSFSFAKKYLIDNELVPFEDENKEILKKEDIKTISFDIETYNPLGVAREEKDPIIMISVCTDKFEKIVFTYKKPKKHIPYLRIYKNEKEIILAFFEFIKQYDPLILFGYNSTSFDIPYILKRCQKLKIKPSFSKFPFENEIIIKKKGLLNIAKTTGRIHFDLYPSLRFFGNIGALKVSKFKLKDAYEQLTKKKAARVKGLEIYKIWDSGNIEELIHYSMMDAYETKVISDFVLPISFELSKITKLPLSEIINSTSSVLVEFLLSYNAKKRNEIIPRKPSEFEAQNRRKNPIEGAFVKIPTPGIYENIAVFDFRGLYPSIICSHNIDPSSLNKQTEDYFLSPSKQKFAKKPMGLIPFVLNDIVKTRSNLKNKLKEIKENKQEYERLFARTQALKILANSFYGYLAFSRSRWYCRDCAQSVTSFGRYYIQNAIDIANKMGFSVLYGDTDSIFLKMDKKKKRDAFLFLKEVNKTLLGNMELELEGFFPRGIFVSKKVGKKSLGAKKKYALIDENSKIKIKGFELVRRDWSIVAKNTQKKVLMAILKEGSEKKAIDIVREEIEKIKSGKYPLKDLIITTKLKKDPNQYDIKSPELFAARKAIENGIELEEGSIVEFIISKSGNSISEKAVPFQLAKDYDSNYYIDNQIIPAVLKIISELGFSKEDLKYGGKQDTLDSFF